MYGVRPKKHLGQHFLKDANIARKIVDSLPAGIINLLEIGPGTGVLTTHLLEKNFQNFRLIEVDRESVEFLQTNFFLHDSRLIAADFLNYPVEELFSDNYWIIGNFPYNISSQIFFRVIEHRDSIDGVVGMIQKEVAQRIASPPGSKEYGILSVLLQAFYTIEYLFTVSESVFVPPPKVKSAVIRLQRNSIKSLDCDEALFKRVVKTSFNTRRKTLRNGVKAFSVLPEFKDHDIFNKRPEQLSVADFVMLTNMIQQ